MTFDFYLGTDEAAVTAATPASPEFMGNQAEPTYAPTLIAGWQYFWRIDPVEGDQTATGEVWSFTMIPATLTLWMR